MGRKLLAVVFIALLSSNCLETLLEDKSVVFEVKHQGIVECFGCAFNAYVLDNSTKRCSFYAYKLPSQVLDVPLPDLDLQLPDHVYLNISDFCGLEMPVEVMVFLYSEKTDPENNDTDYDGFCPHVVFNTEVDVERCSVSVDSYWLQPWYHLNGGENMAFFYFKVPLEANTKLGENSVTSLLALPFSLNDSSCHVTVNGSHSCKFRDHCGRECGKFLLFRPKSHYGSQDLILATVKSSSLTSDGIQDPRACSLEFSLKMSHFEEGQVKVILQTDQVNQRSTDSEIKTFLGNDYQRWETATARIGSPQYQFKIIIEIVREDKEITFPSSAQVALDNIRFTGCLKKRNEVSDCFFKCSDQSCISRHQICNIVVDCPQGEDERQNCGKLPFGAYCSFNDSLAGIAGCGYSNGQRKETSAEWKVKTEKGYSFASPHFNALVHSFADVALMESPRFPALPYYHSLNESVFFNTCFIRFSYLLMSPSSEFLVEFVEQDPRYHRESGRISTLFRKFKTSSNQMASKGWTQMDLQLPYNTSYPFFVRFVASAGVRQIKQTSLSIGVNNVTLSKECFAIDVPESEPREAPTPKIVPSNGAGVLLIPSNAGITNYTFSTCAASGPLGPTLTDCQRVYQNSSTSAVDVAEGNGTQLWVVPKKGSFSIFARGARGGHGSGLPGRGGRGDLIRAVIPLYEGETLYIVVGQMGTDACRDDMHFSLKQQCLRHKNKRGIESLRRVSIGGGGGGGGASYVFKIDANTKKAIPLLVAAGGGGGGAGKEDAAAGESARGIVSRGPDSGGDGEGGGGGWGRSSSLSSHGQSLLSGARGGLVCKEALNWGTNGGFGGGGGGCTSGGGGGGYQGGNSGTRSRGGQGGLSFVNPKFDARPLAAKHSREKQQFDDGLVAIFPSLSNCCDEGRFSCAVLGHDPETGELLQQCICPFGLHPTTCVIPSGSIIDIAENPYHFLLVVCLVMAAAGLLLYVIYFIVCKYQKKYGNNSIPGNNHSVGRDASTSQLLSNSSTDVQLSRLRPGNNITSEYNPNYEFGGSTCTVQDLKEIPRDKLTLVKALGQGAFGEVYQGYLNNMPGEITDELPVAVKTLPEFSANNQAELDFQMEAMIMSKFKHRNIVRFIGVCFEKMPRFIVLELLPGGDLKSFLRESRGTLQKPSPLCLGDLLVVALDVARGCQYLEDNHFIHRDIAARNCLLTSKSKTMNPISSNITINGVFTLNNYNNGYIGSGIVTKIADFGMARDIYRADYYRKGGKAMLPVKWMPSECFLDGIFTSKTDVWSFGVLLWEVLSMGYMPYPGRGNQEVMQFITAGGRLDPPNSCTPAQVYALMQTCWNSVPDLRPNFSTIIERIGYCLVDPDVLKMPLPTFIKAPSTERDTTLMRPPPDATDYLVPNNPCSNSNSNYSMSTEKTELLSPDTCSTVTNDDSKLVELLDEMVVAPPAIPPRVGSWRETTFSGNNSAQDSHSQEPIAQGVDTVKVPSSAADAGNQSQPSDQVSPTNSQLVLSPEALLKEQEKQETPIRYTNVDFNENSPNITKKMNPHKVNC